MKREVLFYRTHKTITLFQTQSMPKTQPTMPTKVIILPVAATKICYNYTWLIVVVLYYCNNNNNNASATGSTGRTTFIKNIIRSDIGTTTTRVPALRIDNNYHFFRILSPSYTKQQQQPSFLLKINPSISTNPSLSATTESDDVVDTMDATENGISSNRSESLASTSIVSSSLLSPLIDPYSSVAKELCVNTLQIPHKQYEQQILQFITLILKWNERINLISRKECTSSTIFTRHVLPSLVGGRILQEKLLTPQQQNQKNMNDDDIPSSVRIIDVGSGGGFPGIPLAIMFRNNNVQLVLADSIAKKVIALQDMVEQLQLSDTVRTYNGRVEEYFTRTTTTSRFDIVTGRSVTALPQFCSWVKELLKDDGHLVYWIGGTIDEIVQEHASYNISIEEYLLSSSASLDVWSDNCDKRILIIPAAGVRTIASMVPESQFQQEQSQKSKATMKSTESRRLQSTTSPRTYGSDNSDNNKLAKGEWRKRNDPDQPKQRGYENFQRYASSSSKKPAAGSDNSSKDNPQQNDR